MSKAKKDDWLSRLKPGDKVGVVADHGRRRRVGVVVRVLKRAVEVGCSKFSLRDGVITPRDRLTPLVHIVPLTPAIVIEHEHQILATRLGQVRWAAHSLETLQRVAEAIEDDPADDADEPRPDGLQQAADAGATVLTGGVDWLEA